MNELENLTSKEENLEKVTASLKAMAHPLRLKILCALRETELGVLEIVNQVGSSQSNVSQHIDILRNKKIIVSRRVGNKILCRIKDTNILLLITTIKDLFC